MTSLPWITCEEGRPAHNGVGKQTPYLILLILTFFLSTNFGMASSHSVTGGVYKAHEQIHCRVVDCGFLVIPAS
ncbi:hypothetical protein KP509_15G071900 [Ceratopteris richardii]|uniref:Uncharacterized protein n=1 Tax=Ceratopteris richardii TaxID=49495 RepID=A0A8T2T4N7_CERRI|nr:hypothetical protein KP509_15G071900 [Ceratopteris richardii]